MDTEVDSAKEFLTVAFYAALAGILLAAFDAYILPKLGV